jgi:hydroxypyruvate isomerase
VYTVCTHRPEIVAFCAFLGFKESAFGVDFSGSLACRSYDFYHQQRGLPQGGGVAPLLAPLRGNVDLLGLVHVADVPGRHAPGTGVIDYLAIYRGLRREGYRGWMAMEFLPTGDAAAELRKAAAETAVPR